METVNYVLTYDNNPAILHDKDEIHFQSVLLPNVGDGLVFQGHRVVITDVQYIPSTIRPVRVQVSGDDESLAAIRELLTFRTDNATHQ